MYNVSLAQYIVKGTISLPSNDKRSLVKLAHIKVTDLGFGDANPESDGSFSIELPKGKHIIEISLEGYKTLTFEVHDPIDGDVKGTAFMGHSNKKKDRSWWSPFTELINYDGKGGLNLFINDGRELTSSESYDVACKYYYCETFNSAFN